MNNEANYHTNEAFTKKTYKRGRLYHLVTFFKHTANLLSSLVKILFAIVGLIFLSSIIMELTGEHAGTTSYQHVIYEGSENSIAVIDLNGTIMDKALLGPFDAVTEPQIITPRRLSKLFSAIKKDLSVKAVILRINSPGGSVTASEEIYQMIKRFRNETKIPVIVSQGEIAASGGYYISLAGDYIMASTTTLTGSIGVIASTINIKKLADTYGVKEITITSGKNKNFLSPFQDPSDEEKNILQKLVDEAYQQFIERIKESRDIPTDTLSTLTDGRPLTGKQAYETRFIDKLGGFYDAVQFARTLAKDPNAQVIEYTDRGVFEALFSASIRPFTAKLPGIFFDPYLKLSGKPAYWYQGG